MWTTRNFGEAVPGVQTPLGLTFWVDTSEVTLVRTTADIGAVARSRARPSTRVEERFMAQFYGRMAGNINRFRDLADRMPGSSGDAFEEQIFGMVRSGGTNHPRRARYPITAVKMPWAAWRTARAQRRDRVEMQTWWAASVAAPPTDLASARALFDDACLRFQKVVGQHGLVTMLAQGCYEQVAILARAAGIPGAEAELITGYGGLEETLLLSELWKVAREGGSLDGFVARHGYHGPYSGDLSLPSWREDSREVSALLAAYRELPATEQPELRQQRQTESRLTMERRLLDALPFWRRPLARAVLTAAARFVPLREIGKTAYIMALDVARLAARIAGAEMAATGLVADGGDVFYLTRAELAAALPDDIRAVIAERRAFHEHCRTLRLPDYWDGSPEPLPIADAGPDEGVMLQGIGVAPGVVTGTVRVVDGHDEPEAESLQPGEILVCETTNPSWVTLFLVADAMVIDIGGVISHGAIAARELGIPCVINTRDGTRRLRTGDVVRVDGSSGSVEVLQRAEACVSERQGND
jgi:pyruvate,water dikinase